MRRKLLRHPMARVVALAVTLIVAVTAWFAVTVAYPRMADPAAIPELTAPISFSSPLDASAIESTLSRLADTFLARADNAGIVIGVAVDGRRYTIARGVSSKSRNLRPIDEDSLFEIASVTKVFTGIALARALLRNELTLDQPIAELLPAAYVSDALRARDIRVIDLATHHAGLQRSPSAIPAWSPMFPGNPWAELTEADMVASLDKALGDPPVATGYSYSGFGYMLLGRVLEQASGRTYAQLIEEDVAAPLGMTSTRVVLTDEARARLVDGHRNGRTMEHHLDHTFPAAGGIATSLNDLLTLVEANLHPEETALADALRLAVRDLRPVDEDTRIALGWHVDTGPEGTRSIYHHGAMLGFWSYVGFSPEARVGVVVLANSRDPSVSALGVELLAGLARARTTSAVPQ